MIFSLVVKVSARTILFLYTSLTKCIGAFISSLDFVGDARVTLLLLHEVVDEDYNKHDNNKPHDDCESQKASLDICVMVVVRDSCLGIENWLLGRYHSLGDRTWLCSKGWS